MQQTSPGIKAKNALDSPRQCEETFLSLTCCDNIHIPSKAGHRCLSFNRKPKLQWILQNAQGQDSCSWKHFAVAENNIRADEKGPSKAVESLHSHFTYSNYPQPKQHKAEVQKWFCNLQLVLVLNVSIKVKYFKLKSQVRNPVDFMNEGTHLYSGCFIKFTRKTKNHFLYSKLYSQICMKVYSHPLHTEAFDLQVKIVNKMN